MRVLKWTVPVDDQRHAIGQGEVVHVQCQFIADEVQVWTLERFEAEAKRMVQVYGTGHQVPDDLIWVGTTLPTPDLCWHVFAEW